MPYLPARLARLVARLLQRSIQRPWMPVRAQRGWYAVVSAVARRPHGVSRAAEELGGVRAARFEAPGADATRAVLYLHGGMFVLGSARTHGGLAAWIAQAVHAPTYLLEYRLAPEHPHPAAFDDTLAAYRALLAAGIEPGRLAVAGDSSGAALALALALRLRDAAEPSPAGLILINGLLDLRCSGESASANARRDAGLRRSWAVASAEAYLAGSDPSRSEVAPLKADLHGLPPIHLQVGGHDLALSDSEQLERRARAAGVKVSSRRFEGMWHDFQLLAGQLRSADEAIDDIGDAAHGFWARPGHRG